jgi:hypothetical protein
MLFRSIEIKFVQLPLNGDEAITIDCDMCRRCHKKCAMTMALSESLKQKRVRGGELHALIFNGKYVFTFLRFSAVNTKYSPYFKTPLLPEFTY